jgi:flagellar hook-basal body complex protein FliE
MIIDPIAFQWSVPSQAQTPAPAFIDGMQPTRESAQPDDFGSMISQMIAETASALHQAEATSVAAIKGQVPVQDVVESVLAAEQMLQAAIAVRDKVTAAYLELSRMGI